MVDTDRSWELIAKTDPYWGVLGYDEYLGSDLDSATAERFFRSGEEHISHVLEVIRERFAPDFAPSSALDFGCGVGRLLLPLSDTCKRVVGVDVSESMLRRASEHLHKAGKPDVSLVGAGDLREAGGPFDLVHSVLVLQHIPPARGLPILGQLVDLISPGGFGVIQLHVRGAGSRLVRTARRVRERSVVANDLIVKAMRRPQRDALVLVHEYDVAAVTALLAERGIGAVYSEISARPDGHLDTVLYFRHP